MALACHDVSGCKTVGIMTDGAIPIVKYCTCFVQSFREVYRGRSASADAGVEERDGMRSCCCESCSRGDWPFVTVGQRPKEGVGVRNGRARRVPHALRYMLSVKHIEQS